jgi:hypothetical protein
MKEKRRRGSSRLPAFEDHKEKRSLNGSCSLLTLDARPLRQLAGMLTRHAEILTVDPLAAAGALHEMIGFVFSNQPLFEFVRIPVAPFIFLRKCFGFWCRTT